jgi:glycine/D-amino acid oxidase-like deaminating enzyme
VDGYVNPEGGYAESGPVVARLVEEARGAGVRLLTGVTFARLAVRGSRVRGIVSTDGAELAAEGVVMATGAWTPHALPFLADHLRSVGQPVFHLAPPQAAPFQAARFPVFGADITATGYYGFPATGDGVVKIANHGVGRVMHPESSERAVTAEETARLRAFLREAFPGLAGAPIVSTRVCLYCDTRDGHFWIARDPDRDGLVVATGDSGHAFKFAPVLGDLIADVVDDVPTPILQKFRWRPEVRPARPHEAARHHGAR